jgi:hypothetical protein
MKSLYGLKQSGRNWREMINGWMKDYGFAQSLKDPCLYVLKHAHGSLIVGIYVDDLIICDDSTTRPRATSSFRHHRRVQDDHH